MTARDGEAVGDVDGELCEAPTVPPGTCMQCGNPTAGALFCVPCGRCAARDLPRGYRLETRDLGVAARRPDGSGVGVAQGSRHGAHIWPNRRTAVWACRLDLGRRRHEARGVGADGED